MAVMSTTNEISKKIGVSKRTLQYYDDEGLLSLARTEQNHRVYDQATMQRIWEILIYKEMGFELRDIKIILDQSKQEQLDELQQYMHKLEKRIENLKVQEEFIIRMMDSGMPQLPDTSGEKTYVECISGMREEIRRKISKDTLIKNTQEKSL